MTTFRAEVLFVGSNAPTLAAKCYIQYFPDGDRSRQISCSSSSTFVIINNHDTTCNQSPTSTPPSTPIPNLNTTEPVGTGIEPPPVSSAVVRLPAPAFGSLVGILCSIVAIETTLLIIILIVYFFVKYKRFGGANSDNVVVIRHRQVRDAEADNNVAGRPAAGEPNNGIVQRASLPHMVD
jgi:hypothetical protein